MKNILLILFISLFLFNVFGYYGMFLGLHYYNTQQVIKKLDADRYDESATLTFAVSLAIPYAASSSDFERIDGEFIHNGEHYRLVKQRYYRDTLYVVCIKDPQSKQISQALADYVKTFAGEPVSSKSNNKLTFNFIKDYIATKFIKARFNRSWNYTFSFGYKSDFYTSMFLSILTPPPKVS